MRWLALLCLWAGVCSAQQNPIIKTVKPAGGGDFTTLQAWEDWADDQTSGYQWAECYVGELGNTIITGWATPPTADRYARVYAPTAQRYSGVGTPDAFYGACFYVRSGVRPLRIENVAYVRLEGLFVRHAGGRTTIDVYVTQPVGFQMTSCMIVYSNGGVYSSPPGAQVYLGLSSIGYAGNRQFPTVIANNMFVGKSAYNPVYNSRTSGQGIRAYLNGSNSLVVANNSFCGMGSYGCVVYLLNSTGKVVCVNNYSGSCVTDYGLLNPPAGSTNHQVTFNYNISSDATATNLSRVYGGAGCASGVLATNVFVNPVRNWRLLPTAPIVDIGTMACCSMDMWKPSTWRPRGYGIDIGAQEQTNKPSVANFESMFNFPDVGEAVYFP